MSVRVFASSAKVSRTGLLLDTLPLVELEVTLLLSSRNSTFPEETIKIKKGPFLHGKSLLSILKSAYWVTISFLVVDWSFTVNFTK
jgi:hypothetical protein